MRLPPSVPRYLIGQALFGVALGIVAGACILVLDVAGLGTLAAGSADPPTSVFLVVLESVLLFVPVVFATAVGLLAYEE